MTKKATDIVAYITWVGLIIAFLLGDREESRFHLNQALVIWLAGLVFGVLGIVPLVGKLIAGVGGALCLVFAVLGILSALKDDETPLPLIGGIKLLK